ncbi:MAG: hypothetical protein WC719_01910 [Patescibacteria group bacterium]|jgi:hypothetical protein
MKLNNLTKGAIAFSAISVLTSGILMASAATDTAAASTANAVGSGYGRGLAKEARIRPENMTEAQKAAVEARRTEMETKMTAVRAALTASDYNAWVAAEKAINEDCPMLAKITADNFSKYAEAMKLRLQADAIMKDLGVDGPGMGQGLGMGLGMGQGLGHGEGRGQK